MFNASTIISNASVFANFTIDGVTKGTDEVFLLSAKDYNVTFSAPGFFNKTQQITVTVLQNETITIIDVSSTVINVTAISFLTNNIGIKKGRSFNPSPLHFKND